MMKDISTETSNLTKEARFVFISLSPFAEKGQELPVPRKCAAASCLENFTCL